jgi:23S rRNA maturation-related 3'-5' exoribonuclease YhaM
MTNEMDPLARMKAMAKEENRRLRKKWGQPVEVRPNLEVMSKMAERVNEMLKRGNTRAHIAGYLNISLAHVGRLCRDYGLPRED